MRPDEEPQLADRWTLADADNDNFTSAPEELPWGTGHIGELWLGNGDYDGHGPNRTRKPIPQDGATICACGWPLPIRWQWSECEFDGPPAWRSIHPNMETVLDADPLLYRVAPWLWSFCECSGCVGRGKQRGRPPVNCTRCDRARRNTQRRAAYALKKVAAEYHRVFVP